MPKQARKMLDMQRRYRVIEAAGGGSSSASSDKSMDLPKEVKFLKKIAEERESPNAARDNYDSAAA